MTSDGTLRLMSEIGKHSNSSEPWTNSHVRSGLSQSDRFVGRTKKLPVCRQWRFYVGLGGAIAPPVLALHPHFGMVQQLLSLWIKLFYFVVLIEMTENLKFHCGQTDDETFFFWKFHKLMGRANRDGRPRPQELWSITHPQFWRSRTATACNPRKIAPNI